jgi:hypothetical protein
MHGTVVVLTGNTHLKSIGVEEPSKHREDYTDACGPVTPRIRNQRSDASQQSVLL